MNVISLNETNEFLLSNGYDSIDLELYDRVSVQSQSKDGSMIYPEFVSSMDILKGYNLSLSVYNDLLKTVESDDVEDDIFDF